LDPLFFSVVLKIKQEDTLMEKYVLCQALSQQNPSPPLKKARYGHMVRPSFSKEAFDV